MSGDYSRQRFDPKNDFSGVLMQQGRVQLDADWNEWVEILDRRRRAETVDTLGRCVVPRQTPQGFQIQIAGGDVSIGRGRIYVDGLLAENEGVGSREFDAVLSELRGTEPTPYGEQPYLPDAANVAPLPEGGPHLLYVDVWQREVTALERPDLVEPAVGVDTTNRLQTVWQVRALANIGNATCETPDADVPGWMDVIAPSAGRLTTKAVDVPDPKNLCLIPPSGGYRGLENRLYRVEIHDGGAIGTATFKWSRDNASVATAVTSLPAPDILGVVRVGRDTVLRFNPNDWIEISDDRREFALLPGLIRQIKDVDDDRQTLTLTEPLPPGEFPIDAQGLTEPGRHTRVKRWDQSGVVRDTDGNVLVDLSSSGSGVIPVPAAGTSLVLEDGVQVTFDVEADGRFRVGDYWVFAARTADASVELLEKAPPRGVHHHYGRLAIVTSNAVSDCRVLWPPEAGGGESCDCSVCVSPESHNSGALTIQDAIERVREIGGTVCLAVGQYRLGERPMRFEGAQSVRLHGQGWKTQLFYEGNGPAVQVERARGVTVEDVLVLASGLSDGNPLLALRNCVGFTLQRSFLLQLRGGDGSGPVIGASGILAGALIRENVLFGNIGLGNIRGRDDGNAPLATFKLHFDDNFLFCRQRGISLEEMSLHAGQTRVAGNYVMGGEAGAIVARGWVMPGSGLEVRANEIRTSGAGIVVGVDGARICDNDIGPAAGEANRDKGGDGIVLASGLAPGGQKPTGLDRCQIKGNTIRAIVGDGIAIQTRVAAATIAGNHIEDTGGDGIVMREGGGAESLGIEGNRILNVALRADSTQQMAVGIRLQRVMQGAVCGNVVRGVGRETPRSSSRAGIQVIASASVRVAGNEVGEIGPGEFEKETVGIEFMGPWERADVGDNAVRRNAIGQEPQSMPGAWFALRLRGTAPQRLENAPSAVANPFGGNLIITIPGGGFGIFGAQLVRLPGGRETAAVRGNLFQAQGDSPTVDVTSSGSILFGDNRCFLVSRARIPVVTMRVGAAAVSSNHLQCAMPIPALRVDVQGGAATILGNMVSGGILLNGAALPAPWAALNVSA